MKLNEIVKELDLKVLASHECLDREVSDGYVSDLLSDVMANSREKNLWITLQTHMNIVAVAALKRLSAIVIVNGRVPGQDTLSKAESENIPVLSTGESAFKLAGMLYNILYAQDS
jgi:predicted transcriptional regulator